MVSARTISDPLNEPLNRARQAWREGARLEAVAIVQSAIRTAPRTPALHAVLAEMWLRLERPELALEWAARAHKLAPSRRTQSLLERARPCFAPLDEGDDLEGTVLSFALRPPRRPRASDTEQMQALLGGSLFGEEMVRTALHVVRPRSPSRPLLVYAIRFLFVISFALGAGALFTVGLTRQAEKRSEDLARELRHLLAIGALESAASLVVSLDEEVKEAKTSAYDDLLAFAEAVLLAHHDALPKRRAHAMSLLHDGRGSGTIEGATAKLILDLESGRPIGPAEVERLLQIEPKDANLFVILAAAKEAAGDLRGAGEALARAEQIEPAHLPYLFRRFEVLKRLGEEREARELADRMTDASPSSPWTRLAKAIAASSEDEIAGLAEDPSAPPVVRRRARSK
jgi:tetratricopeptide (TPR) repeat protein